MLPELWYTLNAVEPPTQKSYHLKTNTVPSPEDDLFGQLVLPESDDVTPGEMVLILYSSWVYCSLSLSLIVQHGCLYKGNEYEPDSMVQLDSCTYM